MTHSSVIAGSLVLAYVIFVINKGELPCYLQLLGIATAANCPAGQAVSTAATTLGSNVTVQRAGAGTGIGIGGVNIGVGGINIGIGAG